MLKLMSMIGMSIVLMLLLAACSSTGSEPDVKPQGTSLPTSFPAPTAAIETLPVGHQLFITKGCAACHGQAAEGSAIAPALGGHTGNQVRRQARAPLGLMPVFPPDRLSNSEMGEIAGFIQSLSGAHGHQRPVARADASAQHHWMALFALEDGQPSEAAHHINHVIELVSGEHLARMGDALRLIESANPHDAEHVIEGMIAGTAAPDVTSPEMHLRLAASSAIVVSAEDAVHHLEHYSDLIADASPEAAIALGAIELLRAGELVEAGHEISGLVGGEDEKEKENGHEEEESEPGHED